MASTIETHLVSIKNFIHFMSRYMFMVPTINNEITQVSSEVNIWRVYPGTKHNFYKFFYGNYCVFLEVPGINMDLIELKSKKLIIEKLAMSKAIAKWHLTDHHLRGSYPSTDHNDYAFNIDMKSIGPSFANLERLYKTAKKGDIIIVPQGKDRKSTRLNSSH